MNLLCTGGCGFIGSHFIEHAIRFAGVNKVVNLDCLTYAGNLENIPAEVQDDPKYVFEKVNLLDRGSLLHVLGDHQISHVVHLAAESHVDRSISGPESFIETNVVGTANLLAACETIWNSERRLKLLHRFLHVSTDEVYGTLGPTGYFTEESNYAPRSPYSASKAASDMIVQAYRHTYGLRTLITHSGNNFGPRQHPEKFIPVVINSLRRGVQIPIYGNGLNVRDWIYVKDHVAYLWYVLNLGAIGSTYNIGTRNERSNLELAVTICDLFGEMTGELNLRDKMITFVEDRKGHDWRYAIDPTKLREHFPQVSPTPFIAALRETVRSYLKSKLS